MFGHNFWVAFHEICCGVLLVVETDCDCIETPHHRRKTSSAAFGMRKDQCTFLPQLADRVQRRAFGWLAEVVSDVTGLCRAYYIYVLIDAHPRQGLPK